MLTLKGIAIILSVVLTNSLGVASVAVPVTTIKNVKGVGAPTDTPVTLLTFPHTNGIDANTAKAIVLDLAKRLDIKGVDSTGPIPKDATNVDPQSVGLSGSSDPNSKVFTFKAGSKAALWASAQVWFEQFHQFLPEGHEFKRDLMKRQSPKVGIGMWTGGQNGWNGSPRPCQGDGLWVDNARYNVNYSNNLNRYSVGISYRSLQPAERLSFYRWGVRDPSGGLQQCGTHVFNAGVQTPVGCFISQQINCFNLRRV